MLAPALAPVLGGIFSQYLGWRWIFWFLVIMIGIYLIPFLITFPETGRNVVGNGSIPPQGWNMSLLNYLQLRRSVKAEAQTPDLSRTPTRDSIRQARAALTSTRRLRWPNPLKTLRIVFSKESGLLLFYNSLVYTAFYDLIASIPYLFTATYGLNDLHLGLAFLPFGLGCLIAPSLSGRLCDWNYRRHAARLGIPIDRRRGENMRFLPIEAIRLQIAAPMLVVGDAALLAYGWVMHARLHIAAPLVLHFVMGVALMGCFN
ncbi:hypothetical protein LTS18_000935, partial [Coniosporium uncinatum]